MSAKYKQKRYGKSIQLYVDEDLYHEFKRVVAAYDADLGAVTALRKLMAQAVADYWIPGYIRKEKTMTRGEPTGDIAPRKPLTQKPSRDIINS